MTLDTTKSNDGDVLFTEDGADFVAAKSDI